MATDFQSTWYLRLRGQTLGPMSGAELEQLVRDGAISATDEISADAHVWMAASERWKSLTPGPQIQITAGSTAPRWGIAFGVVAVCAYGLFLLLLLIVCAGLMQSTQPSTTANQSGSTTWDYWATAQEEIGAAGTELQQLSDPMARLDLAASRLESLPATGIDADAVTVTLNAAQVLRQIASWGRQQRDPGLLVEAFLRGAQGDPFGVAVEQRQRQAALQATYSNVQQQAASVRAALSQRYGREFPPLGI